MAPPWVNEAVNCLLEHRRIRAVGALELVQDATVKAWDDWDAARDDSYPAGRELILVIPIAGHAEFERRFSEMRAPLTAAAQAAGLSYLRLDTDAPANILVIEVDRGRPTQTPSPAMGATNSVSKSAPLTA